MRNCKLLCTLNSPASYEQPKVTVFVIAEKVLDCTDAFSFPFMFTYLILISKITNSYTASSQELSEKQPGTERTARTWLTFSATWPLSKEMNNVMVPHNPRPHHPVGTQDGWASGHYQGKASQVMQLWAWWEMKWLKNIFCGLKYMQAAVKAALES